ncbi:MAG: hypothetical protein HFH08_02490 [Bacilli bacterium]|nr:hypothetical protein [Bacilli bacterium]
MNWNNLDVHKIILMSRKKLDIRNLCIRNLSIFLSAICAASLFYNNVLHQSLSLLFCVGSGSVIAIKSLAEIVIFGKKKYEASKQLISLTKYLVQEGIDVNKLSLKRAIIAEKPRVLLTRNYGIAEVTEYMTIFRDRADKLKALRQTRSKLVQEFRPLTSGDIIDGDFIEIIDNSERVEKILEKTIIGRRF